MRHTTPHHTTPHHTAPHRTTPHRTTPHRTAPHHTTPHSKQLLFNLGPTRLKTFTVGIGAMAEFGVLGAMAEAASGTFTLASLDSAQVRGWGVYT